MMMKIEFAGDVKEIQAGLNIIAGRLGLEMRPSGFPIRIEKSAKPGLAVGIRNGSGKIRYNEKVQFFRALGLLVEALRDKKKELELEEIPKFSLNSALLDASNNAIPRVETVKEFIEIIALMGLNGLMLYTKDTYKLSDYPYFGYMRGSYTHDELKECDQYAELFGVEMIPSIQALAHLDMALKWGFASGIKDNPDILLVGEPKTYELIEKMLTAISSPFRSKRIHLGMDEAHGLGRGRYQDIHGSKCAFDIMTEHLCKVRELCSKIGLKPMIWSDMYFRLASATGDYYDMNASVPESVITAMPDDVQMVFWDYYHEDEKEYHHFLSEHKKFKTLPVFAGGIWLWKGVMPDYRITFSTTNAALAACKKEGIKEVIATIWQDNGGETNHLYALLGLQLFAEHGYSEIVTQEQVKRRFEFCSGGSFDAFYSLTDFDYIEEHEDSYGTPSKCILWQDILHGLFDKNLEGFALPEYYSKLNGRLKDISKNAGKWKWLLEFPEALSSLLADKAEMGVELRRAYLAKDSERLREFVSKRLPGLRKKLTKLRDSHRKQWMQTCKAFGWEVLDIRYGYLFARIDTARTRLNDYLAGRISKIEELEEERLFFDKPGMPHCNRFHRIATASYLSGNYIQV